MLGVFVPRFGWRMLRTRRVGKHLARSSCPAGLAATSLTRWRDRATDCGIVAGTTHYPQHFTTFWERLALKSRYFTLRLPLMTGLCHL
jgi:hypothetical protein